MASNIKAQKRKWALPKLTLKETLLSMAAVILTALFMPVFMYSANCAEANLGELVIPMLLFPALAVAMMFLFFLFTRSLSKAVLISVMMALVLENYSFIEQCIRNVFPQLKYWHVLPICIVVVLHIGYLLYRLLKENIAKYVPIVATVVFGGLIVVNFATAVPSIISKMSTGNSISDDGTEIVGDTNVNTNIYYFVLDEAASFKTLKNYYDYDAAEFRSFLEEKNFNISENSYNEAIDTQMVLTDLLNLDMVTDVSTTASEMSEMRNNPKLIQILKQHNYTCQGIGDTEWINIPSKTTSSSYTNTTIDGSTLLQITMNNTFLYPLFKNNINNAQKIVLDTFNYYDKDVYNKKRCFNFTYICSPHVPFIFDENGNPLPEAHYMDWSNKQYYLGQYKFVMKKTMQAIDNILLNDKECVIFIVSDHGPRQNPEVQGDEKRSVLNCVYYKGDTLDIEGKNIIDSMKLVLEELLGVDFSN